MRAGKLVVLGMFGLAIVLAGVAWNVQRGRGHLVLKVFGSEAALLVRLAPHVELLRLATSRASEDDREGPSGPPFAAFPQPGRVQERISLKSAPGLAHARQALIEDRSYESVVSPGLADPKLPPIEWRDALRFQDGERSVIVLLDCDHRWLGLQSGRQLLRLRSRVAEGLSVFLEEQRRRAKAT